MSPILLEIAGKAFGSAFWSGKVKLKDEEEQEDASQ